jgi:hypothetical protein
VDDKGMLMASLQTSFTDASGSIAQIPNSPCLKMFAE